MTAQDFTHLNEYMNQVADGANASNNNFAPVVPVLDAVEAYKAAQQKFEQAEIDTLTERHCWLDFHIAAHTLSELICEAYNTGARISFNKDGE